ncbi:hypothetical protein OIU85_016891 [Salix viminalis]|uniref:Uncharacterized protein n=1 Tax=Salix viminalis TaxID=40686 RepID=A0A9Q0ZQB1_SALVM|nr:hypothetical protein OIU85_016891 [Salix viminalis]
MFRGLFQSCKVLVSRYLVFLQGVFRFWFRWLTSSQVTRLEVLPLWGLWISLARVLFSRFFGFRFCSAARVWGFQVWRFWDGLSSLSGDFSCVWGSVALGFCCPGFCHACLRFLPGFQGLQSAPSGFSGSPGSRLGVGGSLGFWIMVSGRVGFFEAWGSKRSSESAAMARGSGLRLGSAVDFKGTKPSALGSREWRPPLPLVLRVMAGGLSGFRDEVWLSARLWPSAQGFGFLSVVRLCACLGFRVKAWLLFHVSYFCSHVSGFWLLSAWLSGSGWSPVSWSKVSGLWLWVLGPCSGPRALVSNRALGSRLESPASKALGLSVVSLKLAGFCLPLGFCLCIWSRGFCHGCGSGFRVWARLCPVALMSGFSAPGFRSLPALPLPGLGCLSGSRVHVAQVMASEVLALSALALRGLGSPALALAPLAQALSRTCGLCRAEACSSCPALQVFPISGHLAPVPMGLYSMSWLLSCGLYDWAFGLRPWACLGSSAQSGDCLGPGPWSKYPALALEFGISWFGVEFWLAKFPPRGSSFVISCRGLQAMASAWMRVAGLWLLSFLPRVLVVVRVCCSARSWQPALPLGSGFHVWGSGLEAPAQFGFQGSRLSLFQALAALGAGAPKSWVFSTLFSCCSVALTLHLSVALSGYGSIGPAGLVGCMGFRALELFRLGVLTEALTCSGSALAVLGRFPGFWVSGLKVRLQRFRLWGLFVIGLGPRFGSELRVSGLLAIRGSKFQKPCVLSFAFEVWTLAVGLGVSRGNGFEVLGSVSWFYLAWGFSTGGSGFHGSGSFVLLASAALMPRGFSRTWLRLPARGLCSLVSPVSVATACGFWFLKPRACGSGLGRQLPKAEWLACLGLWGQGSAQMASALASGSLDTAFGVSVAHGSALPQLIGTRVMSRVSPQPHRGSALAQRSSLLPQALLPLWLSALMAPVPGLYTRLSEVLGLGGVLGFKVMALCPGLWLTFWDEGHGPRLSQVRALGFRALPKALVGLGPGPGASGPRALSQAWPFGAGTVAHKPGVPTMLVAFRSCGSQPVCVALSWPHCPGSWAWGSWGSVSCPQAAPEGSLPRVSGSGRVALPRKPRLGAWPHGVLALAAGSPAWRPVARGPGLPEAMARVPVALQVSFSWVQRFLLRVEGWRLGFPGQGYVFVVCPVFHGSCFGFVVSRFWGSCSVLLEGLGQGSASKLALLLPLGSACLGFGFEVGVFESRGFEVLEGFLSQSGFRFGISRQSGFLFKGSRFWDSVGSRVDSVVPHSQGLGFTARVSLALALSSPGSWLSLLVPSFMLISGSEARLLRSGLEVLGSRVRGSHGPWLLSWSWVYRGSGSRSVCPWGPLSVRDLLDVWPSLSWLSVLAPVMSGLSPRSCPGLTSQGSLGSRVCLASLLSAEGLTGSGSQALWPSAPASSHWPGSFAPGVLGLRVRGPGLRHGSSAGLVPCSLPPAILLLSWVLGQGLTAPSPAWGVRGQGPKASASWLPRLRGFREASGFVSRAPMGLAGCLWVLGFGVRVFGVRVFGGPGFGVSQARGFCVCLGVLWGLGSSAWALLCPAPVPTGDFSRPGLWLCHLKMVLGFRVLGSCPCVPGSRPGSSLSSVVVFPVRPWECTWALEAQASLGALGVLGLLGSLGLMSSQAVWLSVSGLQPNSAWGSPNCVLGVRGFSSWLPPAPFKAQLSADHAGSGLWVQAWAQAPTSRAASAGPWVPSSQAQFCDSQAFECPRGSRWLGGLGVLGSGSARLGLGPGSLRFNN